MPRNTAQPSAAAEVQPDAIVADIMEAVAEIADSGDFKPPLLPEVAITLSNLANRPNVDLKDVENAITRDPAVAAKILSVARSAFYSRGAPIKSLRVAIMRIGLLEVRDIAFQLVAGNTIFRVPGYSERVRELFEAAQFSGVIARELCRLTKKEADTAFLCGLLHDVGEAILLGLIVEMSQKNKRPLPDLEALAPILDRYHAPIGAQVCRMWNLPEAISDAVMFHHNADQSNDLQQMALVTAAVDLLLGHIGVRGEENPIDPVDCPEFVALGFDEPLSHKILDFTEMLAESPEEYGLDAVLEEDS